MPLRRALTASALAATAALVGGCPTSFVKPDDPINAQLATFEERPVADGHDDSAWSKNRRVELVYAK